MSEKGGQSRAGLVVALVVAVLAFISSAVWGPPICRAVGVCRDEPTANPFPSFPGPQAAEIFLSKVGGPTGATVNVSGNGFAPGETVVLRFHTTEVGQTKAGSTGSFANVAITIPPGYADFAPAQFFVSASGSSSVKSARASFELSG